MTIESPQTNRHTSDCKTYANLIHGYTYGMIEYNCHDVTTYLEISAMQLKSTNHTRNNRLFF